MPAATAINSFAMSPWRRWSSQIAPRPRNCPAGWGRAQLMKGMSCAGMMTMGRIMSRSSCSRMWQWYM